MTGLGQKIDITGFEIASGVVLGVAIILALGRTYIKINKFHRLFIDDVFFILATILLVAEVNVGAGVEVPPADLTRQLDLDVKFQDASCVLINARKLQTWWWCTFIITIPCAVICMCTEFMVCPAFGGRILEVCVSETALKRQIKVLYVVVVLDIFTDVLLMSIPILLLWSVKINRRRKFGLGSLLCLSIFAIITNIIRASGHKLNNGQDDVVWVLFWLEMEACVAVIANSMTAFRSLFAATTSRIKNSPQRQEKPTGIRMGHEKRPPQVDLPTLPTSKLSGLRSMMLKDPFEDHETIDSDGSVNRSGIQVTTPSDATSSHHIQATHGVRLPFHLCPFL
ncbi:hypothetical protein MMC22_000872 [Lobaria immixta]|nr:hypothetical protein [Lobaria immixta]